MKANAMSTLEMKLQLVRLYILEVEDEYPNLEDGADRLHSVLTIYKRLLRRDLDKSDTDVGHLLEMKETIRECGRLLQDLGAERTVEMNGWFHGIAPRNQAMALANMLSRFILEFTRVLMAFENKYPELRLLFSGERCST